MKEEMLGGVCGTHMEGEILIWKLQLQDKKMTYGNKYRNSRTVTNMSFGNET
jgi:hypothetical protein